MAVNGCDCSIIIKTTHCEKDIPYSDETLREAVSILEEEASIEGDGVRRALRKGGGITGCVVTPLTIGTAPLLLYLAMGSAGKPVYISETRNLYQYALDLLPMEDTETFDLVQDRQGQISNGQLVMSNGERKLFEGCRVKGFELRIMRGEAIKLKLDFISNRPPVICPNTDIFERETGERFNSDFVAYKINGKEYGNIYGLTLISRKEGGTKTELWIKRVLNKGSDLPEIIEELILTAQLLRDKYEQRHYGLFRITIKRLVLVSDETEINAAGGVIGPLRYYVAGAVKTEAFDSEELAMSS